ncbi:MAG: caspase family protein [Verrucomicrobia bacterium]|nr:caspase family protein [Verrucomicrobiota bacterium]
MAKKALLIGINRYQVPGADLRGCVNDVANLKRALIEFAGFKSANIRTLLDRRTTKANMQAGMVRLLKGARKGDVLVLHYSGHGSNVPDRSGDEADHRDEILCPTDLDWADPLLDDWLRTTFDRLPAGVSFTVIMDCCHSGTCTRAVQPPDAPSVERYLPSPLDLWAAESRRRLTGTVRGTLVPAGRAARAKSDVVVADIGEVLITGCRDTQTSADAYIAGSYHGALTYHLVQAIREKQGKLTYRQLHRRTVALLRQGRYDQVPQLEGRTSNLDRPIFAPV